MSDQDCALAEERWRKALRQLERWRFLVYLVGCMFVVAIALLLVFVFLVPSGSMKWVSAVGAVASGGATAFLVKQRNAAEGTEREAWKAVTDLCPEDAVNALRPMRKGR